MICNSLEEIISEIVEETSKEEVVLEKCTDRFDLADYKFGMMIVPDASIQDLSVETVDMFYKRIYATIDSVPFIRRHSELFFCCSEDAYIPPDAAKYTTRNFLDMNYRDLPCFVFGFDLDFKYMHQLFRSICRIGQYSLRLKLLKQRGKTRVMYFLNRPFVLYMGNYFHVPNFDERPDVDDMTTSRENIMNLFEFMEGSYRI